MALKFRRLSVRQTTHALRHRVLNRAEFTSTQSSHDGAMRSASVAMTSGVTAAYNWTQSPASKGILFYTLDLRAELRQTSLSCVFCRNMNSNVSVKLNLSGNRRSGR